MKRRGSICCMLTLPPATEPPAGESCDMWQLAGNEWREGERGEGGRGGGRGFFNLEGFLEDLFEDFLFLV